MVLSDVIFPLKDDCEKDKNKRSRPFSPPTSASGGILSSTTNRVNSVSSAIPLFRYFSRVFFMTLH